MRECINFYICPVCFYVQESPGQHHGRRMVHCEELPIGHERLKPIIDAEGDLRTDAPRWFLEAVREAAGLDYPS